MKIKIRHERIGQHVHAKVYCNGDLTGKLTLRPEEFNSLDEMLSEAAFQLPYQYYQSEEVKHEDNITGNGDSSNMPDNVNDNSNN